MLQNFNSFTRVSLPIRKYSSKISKSTKWKGVVGLEVHAQIAVNSKLFSGSRSDFGSPVNSSVALFDASIPGTLPALNKEAVVAGIKTASALSSRINRTSLFDRKHYFYADLPSGYQITQQRAPLAQNGRLEFPVFVPGVTKKPYTKSVRLHQLQLEQDSGKSLHDDSMGRSLVDLNRAGVPLMELVFEPDLENGDEAAALVKELILILTRIGTCSCRMEEGALRVDANISVHQEGEPLGIRTEVKNIGSIRGVAQAVSFEIERQIRLLDAGKRIHNETRSWDASSRETIAMRDKEVLQDYRFMPEPNLPPLHLDLDGTETSKSRLNVKSITENLPELPSETRTRLTESFGLNAETVIILVNEPVILEHFFAIIGGDSARSPKIVVNILLNELLALCHKNKVEPEELKTSSADIGQLIDLLAAGQINLHATKSILAAMVERPDQSPKEIADANNLWQINDPNELEKICRVAVDRNPKMVEQIRKGKGKVLYALAGEVAKMTKQRANMEMAVKILKKILE